MKIGDTFTLPIDGVPTLFTVERITPTHVILRNESTGERSPFSLYMLRILQRIHETQRFEHT